LTLIAVLAVGPSASALWLEQDIGQPGNPQFTQTYGHDPVGDVFTVYGGGDDIWGNEDEFHFVYDSEPLVGDAIIVARVTDLANTDGWAKAGVMVRNELTDVSTNAMMLVSSTPRASFQYREISPGGSTSSSVAGPGTRPYWVKLTRFGDTLTGYHSPDGETWTSQGSIDIAMASPYVGMAVTSHDNAELGEAKFDNVVLVRSAQTMTWAGSTGNWNSNRWGAGAAFPDQSVTAIVNSGRVDVTGNNAAFGVKMGGPASIVVGAGKSLDIVAGVDAPSGTISLGNDSELSFEHGGGTLGNLTFAGTSTVFPSADLAVTTLRTTGGGATFVKDGGGTLMADNLSVRTDTVFQIDAGVFFPRTAAPLGASTRPLILNGGQLTLAEEGYPAGPGLGGEFYGAGVDPADLYDPIRLTSILDGANGSGFDAFTPDAVGSFPTLNYPTGGTTDSGGDIFANLFDPAANNYNDDFAARWTGKILMETTGAYNFELQANTGARVWIDGQIVVDIVTDERGDNDTPVQIGTFNVPAGQGGQLHDLVVGFYDITGESGIELRWDKGNAGDSIDPRFLSHAASPDYRPINADTMAVEVTDGGGLNLISKGAVDVGPLTLQHGILRTDGAAGGITFASTTIAQGATEVGVDPRVDTDYAAIDGAATDAPFTFSKAGPTTLTLEDGDLLNMENAVIDANEGTLRMSGLGSWGGSTQAQLSGGRLVIAGKADWNPTPAPEGAIAYWSFDDPANPGLDDSGNGHNLQFRGDTAYTASGLLGGALTFDGNGDDATDTAAGNYLNDLAQLTIAMWIKSNAAGIDRGFWECVDSGGSDHWGLRYDSVGATAGGTNLMKIGITTTASGGALNRGQDQQESSENVQTTEWQHVAVTWEDGVGFKMYIDGVLDDAPTSPMQNTTGLTAMINRFTIGDGSKAYWDGMIDDVAIYDTALSADGIGTMIGFGPTDLATHGVSVVADSELVASDTVSLMLGPLSLDPDVTLTTSGAPISFATAGIGGEGEATVGIVSNSDTILTGTSGIDAGGREAVFEIAGTARTIIDKPGTGLENTTFELYGGELVALIDAAGTTLGTDAISFNGGGLVLSSTGGDQAYDVALAIEGDGTLGVAEVPGGVAGATLTYGSAANGLTFSNHANLSLEAADGYTLNVDGPVSGAGGLRAIDGTVNLTDVGPKDYAGSTAAAGGTVTVDVPLPNTSDLLVSGGAKMIVNAEVTTNGGLAAGLTGEYYDFNAQGFRGSGGPAADGWDVFDNLFDPNTPGKEDSIAEFRANHPANVTELLQIPLDLPIGGGANSVGGGNNPFAGIGINVGGNNIVAFWEGMLNVPADGDYTFFSASDDGTIVALDGNIVVNNNDFHGIGGSEVAGAVSLTAGEHPLLVGFYEGGGGAGLHVQWAGPGIEKQLIPVSRLSAPIASKTIVDGGSLELNAALSTGEIRVTGGGRIDVNPGGSLSGTSLTLRGGTVSTGDGVVRLTESFDRSGMVITAASGDFAVGAADLATGLEVLDVNGTIDVAGPRAPISHWAFDETVGTTAANSVDPAHDGTVIGLTAPWMPRGKVGGALNFDGAGYVDVPDGYADFTGGITVSGWVYTIGFTNWARVIDFGNDAGDSNIVLARNGTSSNLRWGFYDTAGGDEQANVNNVFSTYSWQHITVTCDDGPANGATMRVYSNGDLLSEQGGKSVPANVVRVNNYIGESNWDADDFFRGLMDELYIWDRELGPAEVNALYLAGITGQQAPDFTRTKVAGTVTGSGTLSGDLDLAGTVIPAGTLNVGGDVSLTDTATLVIDLDGAAKGQLVNAGNADLRLGGTLEIRPGAVLPAEEGKTITVPIVDSIAEGVIAGAFDAVPPSPGDGEPVSVGHLGQGVFNLGLDYVESFPPATPPNYFTVNASLLIAGGGDANGDGRVDGQDITNLITNFSRPGDPADRDWLKSDTAGGVLGRGDGNVDGQDITDLISNFTGDAGPATQGTAAAEYDPATGRFRVQVEGVLNWSLISDAAFDGSALAAIGDVLPLGDLANLVSANANTVGEGGFNGPMTYAEIELGSLVAPGTDVGQFRLEYITHFGGEPQVGSIHVVPEPGTLALLLAGGLGLLWGRRRRGRTR